jgi:hypothetical protein
MQKQHNEMLDRFGEIERKINSSQQPRERTPPRTESVKDLDTPKRGDVALSAKKNLVISVQKLQRISDTFDGEAS